MQNFSSPVFYPDGLRNLVDNFSRKFQKKSEKLQSKIQKNPNLSISFDAATSKACSCKTSIL
jgi:hypothetical protein